MSEGSVLFKRLRHPGSITVIIVTVLAAVIWADQSRNHSGAMTKGSMSNATSLPSSTQASSVASPVGGELPDIVKRFGNSLPSTGTAQAPEKLNAPGLDSLLAGLESKVQADPENIGNRILLAQTYKELGFRDKALKEMRDVMEKNPSHPRARLVLASILSTSKDQPELKEAITLLDGLKSNTEVKQYLVGMYLGDAFIRMGDHKNALESWKAALEIMPPTDNRRGELEQRISNLGDNV